MKFVDQFRARASKARKVQSKLKLIEKQVEGIEALPPSSRRYPTFRFEQRRDSGREVLSTKGIRKSFDDREVLHGVDLEVRRGARIVNVTSGTQRPLDFDDLRLERGYIGGLAYGRSKLAQTLFTFDLA